MDRTCVKCGHAFRDPSKLRAHEARKTPCDKKEQATESHECENCGRTFSTHPNLRRHQRKSCKKLQGGGLDLDHRLAIQEHEISELRDQIKQLQLAVVPAAVVPAAVVSAAEVPAALAAQALAPHMTQINIINIRPWDDRGGVDLSVEQIAAACARSAAYQEYAAWGTVAQLDGKRALPLVSQILTALAEENYREGSSRNVRPNPRRSDQVMVYREGGWEVRALTRMIREVNDGVSGSLQERVVGAPPPALEGRIQQRDQAALASARIIYEEDPAPYVQQTKKEYEAQLANMGPA